MLGQRGCGSSKLHKKDKSCSLVETKAPKGGRKDPKMPKEIKTFRTGKSRDHRVCLPRDDFYML